MLPVLLDLKIIKIYTFGVFLVLAFFWSSFLLWKNIRLTSYKEDEIFDGLFISLGVSLLVSRLLYVIIHFRDFGFDLLKIVLINGYPGLSFYGGLIGAVLGLYLFFLSRKIKFIDSIDYFVTPAFFALAIGKLGSFFSGTEVGIKTVFPVAIKYVGYDGFRHVTAFYESLLFFFGAFISYKILFEIRRRKYVKGFNFYFFSWFVGLVYFFLDPLKNNRTQVFLSWSINNIVSFIILLTFTLYFLYYFRGLVVKKILLFKHSFFNYGQKTYSNIRKSAGKKTERGEN